MSELDRIRKKALGEQDASTQRLIEREKLWNGYVQEVVADMRSAGLGTIALYNVVGTEITRQPNGRLFGSKPPAVGTGKYSHTANFLGRGWFVEQAVSRQYDRTPYGLLVLEEARVVKCSPNIAQQPLPDVPTMEAPYVALAGKDLADATVVQHLESAEATWLATVPQP
jgi:hypothetical protein